MLPPVIDVEYYNGNGSDPPDEDKARQNLNDLISALKERYGLTPIIYATKTTYNRYIRGHFEDNDIWYAYLYKSRAFGREGLDVLAILRQRTS